LIFLFKNSIERKIGIEVFGFHFQKHSRTDLTTDSVAMGGAEDSDYYTPEDTQTTILSPLCSEKVNPTSNFQYILPIFFKPSSEKFVRPEQIQRESNIHTFGRHQGIVGHFTAR
jgi:hypothetical protein